MELHHSRNLPVNYMNAAREAGPDSQVVEDRLLSDDDVSGRLDGPRLAQSMLNSAQCRWSLSLRPGDIPLLNGDAEICPYKTEHWYTQGSV